MDITIISSKLTTEAGKDVSKADAIAYAETEVRDAIELFDLDPQGVEIRMYTEGSESDPVNKIDIKVVLPGVVINQSGHSRLITRAIDKSIPDLKRQLKRYKNKKIDKNRKKSRNSKEREEKIASIEADEME